MPEKPRSPLEQPKQGQGNNSRHALDPQDPLVGRGGAERRYARDEVAFLVALPVLSATRNSTIRRIRSIGIGLLRGN